MPELDLFPAKEIVGVFRGFREGGMEFHADLVLPYRPDFHAIPMHGQFLLVQLESPDEAVLGRIASFSSEGRLATGSGEEFNIRAVREGRSVPDDLRQDYLRYRVNIRVLGVLRKDGQAVTFVASHRRLPHVGSPVAFPSPEVLRAIVGHAGAGVPIGHYALGEYVYARGSDKLDEQRWMQVTDPEVLTRFPLDALVSRRSFVFARAGFGKSNLTKLLYSMLYKDTPTVPKKGDRLVPVGTIIFDPEGEYFWPDDKGRPGLCDVPWLQNKLVVFTSRMNKSLFYMSFVAGGVKLDIRRLNPADVIAIALAPEKQDQQNVAKLRAMSADRWEQLVELIHANGNSTDLGAISQLLNLDAQTQQVEAVAARSNMTTVVHMLHDPKSLLMDRLLSALSEGKLCVVDVSQMRGGQAMILTGLILRRIFERNQQEFTQAEPDTIPTIAVVEEAQTILNERASAAEPFIAWVKEGRKYDLGSFMITQQPGSIPHEILSQGDNWFLFHLLSASDLNNVYKANAHFSEDLLSGVLNEPIPGQGVFWSSAAERPYPIATRVFSFERMFPRVDPNYNKPAVETFAAELRRRFDRLAERVRESVVVGPAEDGAKSSVKAADVVAATSDSSDGGGEPDFDTYAAVEANAIKALAADQLLVRQINGDGIPWGGLNAFFEKQLPTELDDRKKTAYRLVAKALDRLLGPQDVKWHSFKHPTTGKTWVKAGPPGS